MKVVVLGGAGVMGSYVVEYLSKKSAFSEICIADIDEERAKKVKGTNDKIDFIKIDARNEESLSKILKGADVVINCIGPFYKFAFPIMKAVIKKGVDYVDICDDYDITQKLIDELDKDAIDAGITCIVGLGASPGLTNVIASYASSQMDSVDSIKIYVTRGIKEEAGGAIPYHMLHCWLDEVPVYKDGKYQKARGLIDGEEYVSFPQPFGGTLVYYFGHPETVTLPRYIKVKNVCCKGTFFPQKFREILLQLQKLGFLSTEPINLKGNEIAPLDFLASYIPQLIKKMEKEDIPLGGAVMVEVKGEKNFNERVYKFAGTSRMREATATPAALGAIMIAKGDIKSPGVKSPEACIPAKKFINKLLGENLFENVWRTTTEKLTNELE